MADTSLPRQGPGSAQSGGRATTFQGGKGGTKLTKGATANRKIGTNKINNGTPVIVRAGGGDATPISGVRRSQVGKPPPLRGKSMTPIVRPTQRKPFKAGSS